MRFDDRLATVLRQPAGELHDRAVRWRQLVDLVARAGPDAGGPVVAEALEVIRADRKLLDPNVRSAAARAVARPRLPFALVSYFASEPVAIAAPVLATVELSDEEWQQLASEANAATRRFIATLRPGATAPAGEPAQEQAPKAEPAAPEDSARSATMSDVVARIERVRQSREQQKPAPAARADVPRPRTARSAAAALFQWECGPSGEIDWVDGVPRGAVIGRSIARREGDEGVDRQVERAFAMRAPFRDGRLALEPEGLLAGDWRISGMPAFSDGRFEGYRGVAVREAASATPADVPMLPADPDALRELVHELRTPLNAIVGFAEIIQQQYLGPAETRYLERASEIVAQARLLLTAIEDLDLAARLQASGGLAGAGAGGDAGSLLAAAIAGLKERAGERRIAIEITSIPRSGELAVEAELARRLIARFLGSLVESLPEGAPLQIDVGVTGGQCQISAQTSGRWADPAGLDLRLLRGFARIAGGALDMAGGRIVLSLPAA